MESSASSFMQTLAVGTMKKTTKARFVDGVFCDREQWAGGDMHRRLLWTNVVLNYRLHRDCPEEVRNESPHSLAVAALQFSDHKTVPEEKALLLALQRREDHRAALAVRFAGGHDTEKEILVKRRLRQREVRARADAQRAKEKKGQPSEERYEQVINATSRELLKLLNLRPRVLLEFRMALARSKFDSQTGLKRSFEHFEGGARILVEMVMDMLESRMTSLAEHSMAHWKVICDKAMSKWRPYAKKSAAATGLSEIRFMAAGTSVYKPVEHVAAPMELDVMEETLGALVLEDVRQRLRRVSADDAQAKEYLRFCFSRLKEMQVFRSALVCASSLPWVHNNPELTLLVAGGEKGFSAFKHLEHQIQKAGDYVSLATMSPLGLLQLVVSFVCTSPEGENFWQGLLAWKERFLGRGEEVVDERAALLRFLSVVSCCPRCNSEKTVQCWRKTRSADEPFQFLICCLVCKAASVVE